MTLYYLIRALPFWCQLALGWIFRHQTYFPEDSISDLELSGNHRLIKVSSHPILISCPSDLCIISLFLQKIQMQVHSFIIELGVVVGHSESRGTNLGQDNCLSPISEREMGFTGRSSDSGSVRPEHFGDVFNPSSFLRLELLLQCSHQSLVRRFYLSIRLRAQWS
jgi:hypothetical protein